jgi:sn-glycerol 3-phosphate transport system ATP-binding protein
MASITLRNIVKRYGQGPKANQVIHGVNADIHDREFVVIVGPSGCGKSTLLRMVAGLEEVTGGDILIGDKVVNNLEPAKRDIAMVFQNYALYPHMTVFDNMAYGLKIAKVPKDEIKTRVDKAAKILELGHLLERKPRELSGGQRQRVAMGRAIVRQPQVFLFDEPLSNLDAKLRAQTRLEIQKLHRELGITSLFVTHDQVEAMTLAQRMIVMNAGPGTLLGIRPEHLDVTTEGGWDVEVETVELLGAERLIYGRLNGEALILRVEEGSHAPAPGSRIHVTPRADRIHAFDAASGKRK